MVILLCYWHWYENFNHKGSYLPGVICNIVVKAHFSRSSLHMKCSPRSDITPRIGEMKNPRSDVRWSTQISCQIYPPDKFSDEVTKIRCELKYPDKLSDIPPCANIEFSGLAISHCYWLLVVKNGNFTLLLTSSAQDGNFTLLPTSSGQEWQFHMPTEI